MDHLLSSVTAIIKLLPVRVKKICGRRDALLRRLSSTDGPPLLSSEFNATQYGISGASPLYADVPPGRLYTEAGDSSWG